MDQNKQLKIPSVMNTEEFRAWIIDLWAANDCNYLQTGKVLGHNPNTIRRIVKIKGADSPTLRKKLGVKKSDRKRVSFEVEEDDVLVVNHLTKRDNIDRRTMWKRMIKLYKEAYGWSENEHISQ